MAVLLKPRVLLSLCSHRIESVTRSRAMQTSLFRRNASDRCHYGTRSRLIARPLVISSLSLPFFKGQKVRGSSSFPTQPALPPAVPFELSRIMMPDDTNVSGNVHGGTILKLIEQAGFIVSTRHCNHPGEDGKKGEPLITVLVRLERMDFHKPMFVGEVAQLQAAVTYSSAHSLEVTVDVWAENIVTGEKRLTNTAHLWYVAIPANFLEQGLRGANQDMRASIQPVPQLKGLTKEQTEEGATRYELQKSNRSMNSSNGQSLVYQGSNQTSREVEKHTVLGSQSGLANLILPSDCTVSGHLTGGSLMKMMDNAAGICAARHCMGRVVTACIDEIDFHAPITNGQMVFVTARLVYTSSKSMEIEVTTEAEGLSGNRRVTNTAYFTFVSLGKDLTAQAVPPLVLKSDEEKLRFEEGKLRYEKRKKLRIEKLQKLTAKN